MNADNIFDRVIETYHSLPQSEAKVADYILKRSPDLPYIMISELAKICRVGDANVTRFCRSVGCSSFNDFKLAVAQSFSAQESPGPAIGNDVYGEVQAQDSIDQKSQKLYHIGVKALQQTLELLDPICIHQAVELLTAAKNVYCFGQGNSSIMAMNAWGRFIAVTPKFHWVSEHHMQLFTASAMESDDVVLYFSFSGATRELPELGKVIRRTEGKLILVTRYPNSPGSDYADLLLVCGADEAPRQQGSVAVKFGQLFLIDILYHEFCARNPETSKRNREKTLNSTIPLLL